MKLEASGRSFNSFELYPSDTAMGSSFSISPERKKTFKLLVLINIILNYDSGAIPASLLQIQQQVPLTYTESACLVSLSYLGLAFSSLFVSSIFQKFSATKTLLFALCLNCAFSLVFSFSYNVPSMFISRIGMGLTQAFSVIYAPVWINEFSPKQKESLWMGFLQASVPIGVVFGYLTAGTLSIFNLFSWRFAIQIQSILELPLIVWFAHLNPEEIDIIDQSQDNLHLASLKDQLKMLFGNLLFLLLTFSLCCLYFVVAGVQYWVTLYMLKVLNIQFYIVIIVFVIVSVTAPISGVYAGGKIIEFFGGYKGKNLVDALWVCFISSLLASFCTLPASIATGPFGELVSLWMLLFFGAIIVPCATGVCVNCVEREYQANTSSFLQSCANVGGFFLGPLLGAVYMEKFEDEIEGLRSGFRMVLSVSWIGCFLMGLSLCKARKVV